MLRKTLLSLFAMGLLATLLPAQQEVRIQVNISKRQGSFPPVWAWVGHDEPNHTDSDDGRDLLSKLAELSPFPVYDRAHNLLTSGDGTPALKWGSTNAFTLDASGRPIYDWTILDKIFDTYQATGVVPFVEIGFTPEALSTNPEPYQHHWPGPLFTGWPYPPKDYKQWAELVYQWVQHVVKRYGAQKVKGWEWEVWNEPDIRNGYWHGSMDDYFKLYDYTADAVKRALPAARVGGPATTGPLSQGAAHYLQGFLEHCVNGENYVNGRTGAPLDFISFHAKGKTKFVDEHVEMDLGTNLKNIDVGFGILAGFPTLRALPVVLSESDPEGCAACDATAHPEEGYRLTSQYASYEADLLSGTLALAERRHINLQGAITWAFTFPGQPYFAGNRAFTTHGVDLPLLNLFRMLGMMGGERVAAQSTGALGLDGVLQSSVRGQSDINVMATRGERGVNVLVWNYDDDATTSPPAAISLTVEGLPREGQPVLLEHFRVDQDHSNSFTTWQAMGSPQNPSVAQIAQLKAAGALQLLESPRWTEVKGHAIKLTFAEPSQGVSLVRATW